MTITEAHAAHKTAREAAEAPYRAALDAAEATYRIACEAAEAAHAARRGQRIAADRRSPLSVHLDEERAQLALLTEAAARRADPVAPLVGEVVRS